MKHIVKVYTIIIIILVLSLLKQTAPEEPKISVTVTRVELSYSGKPRVIAEKQEEKEEIPKYIVKSVPSNNSFKSYMSYKTITSKTSNQYKYQQKAITEQNGIRSFNGRYMIAIGTYYCDSVGINVDIVMENGYVIKCITGDIKSDEHTDTMKQKQAWDGSLIEFIVDTNKITTLAKKLGNMSCYDGFDGEIQSIRVYD